MIKLVSGAAGAVGTIVGQIGKIMGCKVITNMNKYGRVPVCGSIANYNDVEEKTGPSLLPFVVYKFLTIQGFLIGDHFSRFHAGNRSIGNMVERRQNHLLRNGHGGL